jgi:hypothetical protein
MDQNEQTPTENQRDESGRFLPGHKGSKPKGAVSRNSREFLERIEYITQLLEETLEEKITSLPAKAHVALWLELNKAIFAKKLPDKELNEDERQIIINLVHADGSVKCINPPDK